MTRLPLTLDGLLRVLDACCRAQALGCNGAHRCERILDPMMELIEDQLLTLTGQHRSGDLCRKGVWARVSSR